MNKYLRLLLFLILTGPPRILNATEIISLGGACNVARAARLNNLRNTAYPLDWLITPIESLKKAFQDDFAQILIPEQTYERDDNKAVIDGYGFVYIHDFPTVRYPSAPIDGEIMPVHELVPDWREAIPIVKAKFNRRLKRLVNVLQNGEPVALVRYNEIDRTEAEQLIKLLKQKFPNAKAVLVAIGCTPGFQEPWNLPHVYNVYIDEQDYRAWDGPAWADAMHTIAALEPHSWSDKETYSYVLTNPLYNPGLFNIFNTVLGAIDWYDRGYIPGLCIDFQDQGWYYDSAHGQNWWNYYFEPIDLGASNEKTQKKLFPNYQKIIFAYESRFEMAPERAHELIQKYICVKPHVMNQVDDFCAKYFGNQFIIGIHFRGTDKVTEVSAVSYQDVVNCAQAELSKHCDKAVKLFVATDDAHFCTYIKKQFPNLVIMRDALRSDNDTGIHMRQDLSPYQKGEDAIIDCLLLSRCSLLIKTASNLSDCSVQFNPLLQVIQLNSSYSQ